MSDFFSAPVHVFDTHLTLPHACIIFDDPAAYRRVALAFIREGLHQNEKCIMATDLYTPEMIAQDFQVDGEPLAEHLKAGRLSIINVQESYSAAGGFDPDITLKIWQDETTRALSDGYKALRVVGEATFALGSPDLIDKLIYYENIINRDLFPHYAFKSLCVYDRNSYPPSVIKAVIKAHPMLIYNDEYYHENIHYIPPELYFKRNSQDDEVNILLANVRRNHNNIQALQESEQKFRMLFDQAPLSYQSLDENGTIIEVNKTWLDVLGYERDEVLGRNFSEFLHPDWQGHFKENFPRFKAVGEVMGVEFELRKKDGTFIHVSFQGKIGKNADNFFQQTHCIFTDITKERELTRRLNQSQKMEAIGNLAGGIAHDLNNILFPIIAYADLLQEDLRGNPAQAQKAREIVKAGQRGAKLVRRILSFSRISHESLGPVRVEQVVDEVLQLCRSTIPRNISLKKAPLSHTGIIQADSDRIHQVAMNLITNAYHAVENVTDPTITVAVTRKSLTKENMGSLELEPGSYVCLSVTDNGQGMPPHVLDKIFDPYFTTKVKDKGTGLGLSVVYGIVKALKGDIYLRSMEGVGTTFYVYFPERLDGDRVNTTVKESQDALPRGTESILLVDDEKSILDIETRMLERLGYRVNPFESSLRALDAFMEASSRYDLVFSDMDMPHMTGDILAQKILDRYPDFPVILCTGFSSRINHQKAEKMGVKKLLMKPVTQSCMAHSVRSALDE